MPASWRAQIWSEEITSLSPYKRRVISSYSKESTGVHKKYPKIYKH